MQSLVSRSALQGAPLPAVDHVAVGAAAAEAATGRRTPAVAPSHSFSDLKDFLRTENPAVDLP